MFCRRLVSHCDHPLRNTDDVIQEPTLGGIAHKELFENGERIATLHSI
jgi:hypothetical protein